MMRSFILAGLALSAPLMVTMQAEGGSWCRIARDAGGRDCSFNSFAQCAASTERLNGGGCIENPNYRGGSTREAIREERTIHHRHRRHDDDNR